MKIKVITNNPLVHNIGIPPDWDFTYLNGTSSDVLFFSRDLVVDGWCLAVDPLDGYNARFNPYHTVFLVSHPGKDVAYEDMLRLERGANHMHDPRRPLCENTPQILNDYRELDFSLAASSLQQLRKYHCYCEESLGT